MTWLPDIGSQVGAAAGAGGGEGCDVGVGVGADEGSGVEGGVVGGAASQVATTNDTTVATMINGTRDRPSASRKTLVSKMAVRGKPFSITTVMAPIPMATPAMVGRPGQMGQENPAGGTEEHAREGRTASEAAQTARVGQTLADEEQGERTHGPAPCVLDEVGQCRLAREEDLRGRPTGSLRSKATAQATDGQADERSEDDPVANDHGADEQPGQAADAGADDGPGDADDRWPTGTRRRDW